MTRSSASTCLTRTHHRTRQLLVSGTGGKVGVSHIDTWSGTNEAPPVENWRIFRRLIGHDNDVQDLGWSYDSSILVSVGLDSKVVIWSGYTFEKLKTISNHQSHVKGLTFDPANKYFATASDDRTIKIFRFTPPGPNSTAHDQMNNFLLEKSITTPFQGSPLTTYFRRCSWSPDGNHIAAANAVNGPVSSVAIINRGQWDGDIHLIGHEGPVEVCAFSPRLFTKVQLESAQRGANAPPVPNLVTVVACAGQDKALSVWITSNPRPLVITQDLAVKSISDLAWGPDGQSLFATSLDGSIIAISFDDGELGYSVSTDENEKAIAKYGGGRKGGGIVEGPGGFLLEEKSKEGEIRGAEGRMGALMGDGGLVSGVNGTDQSAKVSSLTNGVSDLKQAQTNGALNGNADGTQAQTQSKDSRDPEATSHAARLERITKQRVTITKDGRKRIAPLLVSNSNIGESSLPRAQLRASTATNVASDSPRTVLDLSKPVDGLPKGGLAALLLGNRRKLAVLDGDEDGHVEKKVAATSRDGAVPILDSTTSGLLPAQSTPALGGQPPTPEFIRPAVINPSLSVSQVRLAVPKLRATITQSFGGAGGSRTIGGGDTAKSTDATGKSSNSTQTDTVFEARNPTGPSPTGRYEDREPSRLVVTKRGQPIWQDFLPKSVLLMTGSQQFWAVACEDGSIYAWTPAGRRLINALVLESQPVIFENRDSWLLCITAVGLCYVWNVSNLSSPHPPVSLAPILDIATQSLQSHTTKAPAVTSAHLNSEGRILVMLSNGDGYAYSPSMYAWQRLSEVWWAVGSQYWNTTDSSIGNVATTGSKDGGQRAIAVSAGVIPHLEKHTTNEMLVRGRAYFLQRLVKQLLPREGYESFEASVSMAHLENRLAAAMMLGAKEEFQTYLYMYARRLGAEGMKAKVEELLQELLGNVYEEDPLENARPGEEDRFWANATETVCGWPRRDLLKGVVLVLGKGSEG